jgi:Tol biopolymer transport system component/C-terminal processing protease CtpA/Prc
MAFAALAASTQAFAQGGAVVGARSLALSPDGETLAFSWRGDLWLAPAGGGLAAPLTRHVELDDNPYWSPDGQKIAFTSDRNGGDDIYIIDIRGGRTQRVTHHPGSEALGGWSNDGQEILFSSRREAAETALYAIRVADGRLRELARDHRSIRQPWMAADGSVYYTRYGFPATRPRYAGSAAAQIWRLDGSGRRSEVANNSFQHLWPVQAPAGGGILTVTVGEQTPSSSPMNAPIGRITDSPSRTPNVWRISGTSRSQVTRFSGSPVRFLAAARAADRIAFEKDGKVHVGSVNGPHQPVEITAVIDDQFTTVTRSIETTGASQPSISPDGSKAAFVAGNEIWLADVKPGKRPNDKDAVRVTDWAGLDSNPLWTPDGSALLFVSDREGSARIYRWYVETQTIEAVTERDQDALELQITPDKRFVSFWIAGQGGGLYKAPVNGGPARKVFDLPRVFRYESDTSYAWSANGRYVAYTLRRPASSVNIWVYDTQTETSHNITRASAFHAQPSFSSDNRYLYFTSGRDGNNIQWVPLQPVEVRSEDQDLEYKKPEGELPEIDFKDIQRRIGRFSSPGANIRFEAEKGQVYISRGGNVVRVNYDGSGEQTVASGIQGGFEFTADGKSIVFVRGGQPVLVDVTRPNLPSTTVEFRAELTRDTAAVRRAAFQQVWREYNRSFYDSNLHGRDWAEMRRRYEPFLDSVDHRREMATVLNMMIGELDASHAEVSPAFGGVGQPSVAHLGMAFDYSHNGAGIKVRQVPEGAPGSFAKTKINEGEYILKINGEPAVLNEAMFEKVLVNQINRDVTLLVNAKPTEEGAREVRIRAISEGAFRGVIRNNEIAARRAYVEEKSGGRLTYLEIPGMNQAALAQFNYEAWELIQGKEGVVIDVRFNGGGNISDDLVDLIERRPSYIYYLRDTEPTNVPDATWLQNLKTVVLMGESSFSDAEIFPYAMKARGFAQLVGMPTPGYVIGTYGLGLVDGTNARMPAWGVYRLDGSNMENIGEQPDHKVDWTWDAYSKGQDEQLDKAIEVLLRGK